MDRINHLNKIKEYEKQLKQKCKMHRQVSYGYTTTDNPVKRQLAKSIYQQPIRDKSIAHERVEDPYMHSIELARNSQLNDYVFKNADIFLTNIKTEQDKKQTIPEEGELTQELLAQGWRIQLDDEGKKVYVNANTMTSQEEYPTLRHHETPTNIRPLTDELISQGWVIAKNAYGEEVYFNPESFTETFAYPSTEQETEQELTPELLAEGWRKVEDPITRNYMYINISKGGAPQREYPTITQEQDTVVGKPKITLYVLRGQTYYVNNATGVVTRRLPEGINPQDDLIMSNINEPEEIERFINYYKPKFNTRVRGNRVIPDSGLRAALINDINKIYAHPTVFSFFNDYRYLLNKDILESSSRKDLVKQYKSILNILAHHESEIPSTFGDLMKSLTIEFNEARREQTSVNVNHNDEIEQSSETVKESTPSTQSGESVENPLTDDPNYVANQADIERYNQLIQVYQDRLDSGVNHNGEPMSTEERNMYKAQIIMFERLIRDYTQSTPAQPTEEEREEEENIQHPPTPPDPTVPEKAPTQPTQPTQQIPGG